MTRVKYMQRFTDKTKAPVMIADTSIDFIPRLNEQIVIENKLYLVENITYNLFTGCILIEVMYVSMITQESIYNVDLNCSCIDYNKKISKSKFRKI